MDVGARMLALCQQGLPNNSSSLMQVFKKELRLVYFGFPLKSFN